MPKEIFTMSNTNRRAHNQQRRFTLQSTLSLLTTLLLFHAAPSHAAAGHPVFTYKNASSSLGQLVTSSTLVWEPYDAKDPKQLQYAVEGGKYITEDEHYPIYVCRVTIDGVPTSGHTEKIMQSHVCVASHYKHGKYDNFDVLVNKGHLGKIAWKHWRKFNAGVPVGAIRIGEESYIGRHRAQHSAENVWGADYNLGRLVLEGLGKIRVYENEREREYNEGDVLVETEPYKYELKDIKLDKIRLDMRENLTDLASSVLVNREDKYGLVETVMSYEFDYVQYWGTYDGVARGLPTKVYEKDAPVSAEINWGLKYNEKRYETKSVNTKLWPGTALNVTLKGNYVTLEAPYTAKLIAYYFGSSDSVSREITAEVRKSYLKDVKLEFSGVYFIDNGTLVPTTTTTSTTSTTTNPTTTSTEPKPMYEPPVVDVKNIGKTHSGPDSLEKSLHDSPITNEISDDVPDNLAEKHQNHALAGIGKGKDSASSLTYPLCSLIAFAAAVLSATSRRF